MSFLSQKCLGFKNPSRITNCIHNIALLKNKPEKERDFQGRRLLGGDASINAEQNGIQAVYGVLKVQEVSLILSFPTKAAPGRSSMLWAGDIAVSLKASPVSLKASLGTSPGKQPAWPRQYYIGVCFRSFQRISGQQSNRMNPMQSSHDED